MVAQAAVAVSNLILARWTYRVLHRERRRMEPQLAVAFLMFGKASALVGAFVAGGYTGFGLHFIGHEGDLIAFHSMIFLEPQQRLVLFVSYNSATSSRRG